MSRLIPVLSFSHFPSVSLFISAAFVTFLFRYFPSRDLAALVAVFGVSVVVAVKVTIVVTGMIVIGVSDLSASPRSGGREEVHGSVLQWVHVVKSDFPLTFFPGID